VRWYRSLYWRIALGVVGFLALMLVVQAVFFVWAVSQSGRSASGMSPGRLGMSVALDLSSVLERDPNADIEKYLHEQYAQYDHPFFVVMQGGRVITIGSDSLPEPLLRMARARLSGREPMRPDRSDGQPPRDFGRPPGGPGPLGPRGGGGPMGPGDGFGPGPGGGRGRGFGPGFDRFERGAPILVDGQLAGVVVVAPRAPFGFLLERYAPRLTLVAIAVLVVGGVVTSVLIFGPARRRLRALESAARAFGAGDLSARAPDRGGDEIAAVASAFNTMADDLGARAAALAAADQLRRQLLADVSHELNTPVTAMRGYLETLSMPELQLDDATRARYLGIVANETARLERLIGDLLELARLEGGGGALRMEAVPVERLFARVLERHERAAAEGGIALAVTIGPGAETIHADAARIEQAVQNLAANAVRYAPRGTTVRLTARRAGSETTIGVEDEGSGISPEHLPHVFDRFYKGDPARSDVSGGSGLGLSIVKAIVERHGGQVTAHSRQGVQPRTVFELTLPTPRTS
jgi:two-component system OmpR family sensor kinase